MTEVKKFVLKLNPKQYFTRTTITASILKQSAQAHLNILQTLTSTP